MKGRPYGVTFILRPPTLVFPAYGQVGSVTRGMHSNCAGVSFGAKGTRMSLGFLKVPVSTVEMAFPSLPE